MRVLNLSQAPIAEIAQAASSTLSKGKLVIYPTDTVYGIAADATNQTAVDLLKKFKGQRGNKPISIAVRDQEMAEQYANLNDVAKNLYNQFLPGPLTIISNIAQLSLLELAKGIASLEQTVGIRIIPHSFVAELFNHIDFPITATSANISNHPNPRSLEQWLAQTPKNKQEIVDLFIDSGDLPYSQPSTILDTSQEDTQIIRQGNLDLSSLVSHRSSLVQTYVSHSPQETKEIAREFYVNNLSSLNARCSSPVVIALQGPLGAGKTVFTQGLAQALGITEPLRSPTYTLVKEYKLSKPKIDYAHTLSKSALSSRSDLVTAMSQTVERPRTSNVKRHRFYHIDAWRLSSPEEFQDLGIDDMLKPRNIIVIEWPQRLQTILNELGDKTNIISVEINGLGAQRQIYITI